MSLATVVVVVLFLYLCGQGYTQPSTVVVTAQCPNTGDEDNCTVLTDALEQLDSTTTLKLGTGTHSITRYVNISGLQDVIISGGGRDATVVTCDDGVGLAFMNVTGLTLSRFTINGCGLTGEPIVAIMDQIEREIPMAFGVPEAVRYALVLWDCSDVTLSQFLVTNTSGLGLLGVNVLGVSIFQVSFTNNRQPKCIDKPPRYPFTVDDDTYAQIGGGAYFLYQDYMDGRQWEARYTLTINRSDFSRNSECSFSAITQVNFQQFAALGGNSFLVGGGGGLTVHMTQRTYAVDASIMDSVFTDNSARYGGGAHISVFAGVQSRVAFSECRFERNGLEASDSPDARLVAGGAGLALFLDVISQRYLNEPVAAVPENEISVMVTIANTNFTSNSAGVEGGGFFAYSQANTPSRVGFKATHLIFTNCVFAHNSAQYGAAAFLQQNAIDGTFGNLALLLSEVTFNANKPGMTPINFGFQEDVLGVASAVTLRSILAIFLSRVECSDNEGTGMHIHSSVVILNIGSEFLVERNSGQQGGGVHISGEGAGIIWNSATTLSFLNNTASLYGGAIYVSSSVVSNDVLRPVDSATGCVMGPLPNGCLVDDQMCFDESLVGTTILFTGNSAPSGSVMYGSTLEACTWTGDLRRTLNSSESIFKILFEFETIGIDGEPDSPAVISTLPARISVTGQDNRTSLNISPGQSVNLTVKVYDHFNHTIPGTVTAHILTSTATIVPTSGSEQFFFFSDIGAQDAVLTIKGSENDEFQVHFLELSTLVDTNLTISTSECLQGFTFENMIMTCVCNQSLVDRNVQCNLDDLTLNVPDAVWVGTLADKNSTEDLVVASCFEHCRRGDKEISLQPPDYDSQCREGFHRAGVLCGGCLQNYSTVLGDAKCRQCSHWSLLLVPLFGVLGVLLFLTVALLEVTVDNGWMYAVLFFSNLLVLTSPTLPSQFNVIFVPAHLLSLELGIGICFYDGMTALHRVFIKLIFPFYLFLLMLIFTLLTRKVTVSHRFSPVKTFVTLGMMSYTSVLSTCTEILAGVSLVTVGGERQLHWISDPNIVYFSGLHGFLVILATIIIIIYLVPLPLILLSPYIAYRYFKKLIPFLDACWAPYKSNFRWWLGMRLLVRLVLFFSFSINFLRPYSDIICAIILLILIEFELSARPFKMEWINILDSILIGDVLALIIGMFLVETGYVRAVYSIITIFCGYVITCGVLLHHSRRSEIWRMLKERFSAKKMKKVDTEIIMATLAVGDQQQQQQHAVVETSLESTCPPSEVPEGPLTPSRSSVRMSMQIDPVLSHTPIMADFSHLRESLLESQ